MPRVPVHDVDTCPEASREARKALEGKFGKVVNIFGEMAHAPALLALFTNAEAAIAEHTSLEPHVRAAIHLAVANLNECDYCQAAYTIEAIRAGFTQEQTVKVRRGDVDFDPALAALLSVVRQAAERKGYVTDDAWQAALDAGWSERQLLEAFADAIRTLLTNYFNHFVGTEMDLPTAPDLEAA